MSDESIDRMNDLLEWEPLSPDEIVLSDRQIDNAFELSQRTPVLGARWQIYLTALALNGFEQWLRDRASDITVQRTHCTILSPSIVDATTAACNLQVNGFRLCIIGTESVFDQDIAVPVAAIDAPECMAHFYVPVEVDEAQGTTVLRGFLRYDQLQQHPSTSLERSQDGTYRLPFDWFEPDCNRLLLHLSCLDPIAMRLPAKAHPPQQLHQILVQPAINMGLWLQRQWDEVLSDLDWMSLPPLELAVAMRGTLNTDRRSPDATFTTILATLKGQGLVVPQQLQGIYHDWIFSNTPLRLYVATAPVSGMTQAPEWSLLLILTTQNQLNLPVGIRLQVSDGHILIGEQTLTDATSADYLYLTAIGNLEEQFIATITLLNGTSITLPPFRYSPAGMNKTT